MPTAIKTNKTGEPRDTQRQKVYDWENSTIEPCSPYDKNRTLLELGQLIQKAYKRYGFTFDPKTQLRDGRGRRRACFDYGVSGGCIKLPLWARSKWVALHEAAHGIVWLMHKKDHTKFAAHGPEFVRVYIDLLDYFLKIMDMTALLKTSRDAGIKVAPAAKVAPPKRATLTKRDALQAEIASLDAQIKELSAKRRELAVQLSAINKEIRA